MYESIKSNVVRVPSFVSAPAKSCLLSLLQKHASERLGFGAAGARDVKRHSFFTGVDFEKLARFEIDAPFVPTVMDDEDCMNFEGTYTKEPVAGGDAGGEDAVAASASSSSSRKRLVSLVSLKKHKDAFKDFDFTSPPTLPKQNSRLNIYSNSMPECGGASKDDTFSSCSEMALYADTASPSSMENRPGRGISRTGRSFVFCL